MKYEVLASDLSWEASSEKGFGADSEFHYEAVVKHEVLGELRWAISEYPAGYESHRETDVGVHALIRDIEYGFDRSIDESEIDPREIPKWFRENQEWVAQATIGTLIEYMVDWFHFFFEDPANETPHDSREGGYIYIRGGPYTAEEEIGGIFGGLVSDSVIDAAIEKVQSDGLFDWAPTSHHESSIDFYGEVLDEQLNQEDFGFQELREIAVSEQAIGIGTQEELSARIGLSKKLEGFNKSFVAPKPHGGIGHNHPPEDLGVTEGDIESIKQSLSRIEKELSSEKPDTEVVANQSLTLQKVSSWALGKADKTVDEFTKGFASTLGKTAAVGLAAIPVSQFWTELSDILGGVKQWLIIALGI